MDSTTKSNISFIARVALLGAMATLLMLFEFPLPFIAPSFYKFDFSEVPVLIGTFAMGPAAGVVIELIKVIMNLILNGTITAGVGETANLIMGCAFILPAGIIYERKKTKSGALLGMLVGTIVFSAVSVAVNAFIMIPAYIYLAKLDRDTIIGMATSIIPAADSITKLALFCALPFNFIKGVAVSLITFFIYKPLHPLLKKIEFK